MLALGAGASYFAFKNEKGGTALLVGVAVVVLLIQVLELDAESEQKQGDPSPSSTSSSTAGSPPARGSHGDVPPSYGESESDHEADGGLVDDLPWGEFGIGGARGMGGDGGLGGAVVFPGADLFAQPVGKLLPGGAVAGGAEF